MGMIGSFVKGAVAGVVALGILSWLYSDVIAPGKDDEAEEE